MVRIAEEPLIFKEAEPDISIPQVFSLPKCPLKDIRIPQVQKVLRSVQEAYIEKTPDQFSASYNKLTSELAPLTEWLIYTWDYLLTKQGPRFVERTHTQRSYMRGDYRAITLSDFQRLVFHEFKHYMLTTVPEEFTAQRARSAIWKVIQEKYSLLKIPKDARQRSLTAYSYLRCVPYRFLNNFHENRVQKIIKTLPREEQEVVCLYFLHFFKPETIADKKKTSLEKVSHFLKRGLKNLSRNDFLSYCLLVQISRY